jgi:hypothetical protein
VTEREGVVAWCPPAMDVWRDQRERLDLLLSIDDRREADVEDERRRSCWTESESLAVDDRRENMVLVCSRV